MELSSGAGLSTYEAVSNCIITRFLRRWSVAGISVWRALAFTKHGRCSTALEHGLWIGVGALTLEAGPCLVHEELKTASSLGVRLACFVGGTWILYCTSRACGVLA
jgi:hypothetical protein